METLLIGVGLFWGSAFFFAVVHEIDVALQKRRSRLREARQREDLAQQHALAQAQHAWAWQQAWIEHQARELDAVARRQTERYCMLTPSQRDPHWYDQPPCIEACRSVYR